MDYLASALNKLEKEKRQKELVKNLQPKYKKGLKITEQMSEVIAAFLDLPLEEVSQIVDSHIEKVKNNDLSGLEEMLTNQALLLNAIFMQLMSKSATLINSDVVVDNVELAETLIKLGLKAQEQTRKTTIAITDLKNPKKPTQFIKNYVDKQLNQLNQPLALKESNYEEVDIKREEETSTINSEVETLGEINRTSNRRRQKKS